MKCPNCDTEVFDQYTTEDRIRRLYKANLTQNWAKTRLRTLYEMIDDRLQRPNIWKDMPLSWEFVARDIKEIMDKMEIVN